MMCERLADMLPRFGGTMDVKPGDAVRVDYAIPAEAPEEIRDFLRPLSTMEFEPGFTARLPGGRVLGSGNVLAPDGQSVARDVSTDFGKPFDDHWLLTCQKIPEPVTVRGTTAVVATTLGAGYAHWLIEELPRLLTLKSGEVDTIIAHATQSFSREALTLFGFSGKILEPRRYSHFACEQLVIPSLIGQAGHPTPEVVRVLRDFTQLGFSGLGERLYISRGKARRRRLVNEAVVWGWLETQGFAKVHLEELTWAEQIRAFASARVIVSPHGAGLANLVFCRAGTRVVELFNRAYFNPCFWRVAAIRELDYRPVVSLSSEPLAHNLQAGRFDIEVSLEQVRQALV